LLFGLNEFAPAEMLPVRKAGMSSGADATTCRRSQSLKSRCRVPGMKPAGDIGRGNERHELFIQATAFAQIAVQINFHCRNYKTAEISPIVRRQVWRKRNRYWRSTDRKRQWCQTRGQTM